MEPRQKICPTCQTVASIDAGSCLKCGHVFRTKFVPDSPPTSPQVGFGPYSQISYQPSNPQPPTPGPYGHGSLPPQPGPAQQPYGGYAQPHETYSQPPNPYPPQNPYYQAARLGPSHSPLTAVLLSLLCITGAGQWYNRQIGKAVLTLLAFVVFSVATLSSWGAGGILAVVVAAVDAFKVAERIRRGEVVGDWQWF